jgi:hypothetical protein
MKITHESESNFINVISYGFDPTVMPPKKVKVIELNTKHFIVCGCELVIKVAKKVVN